jgi:hypothetical protein
MYFQKGNLNRKGVIGGFMVTFIATVIIILLLLLFVIFSGTFKEYFSAGGTVIRSKGISYSAGWEKIIIPYPFKLETLLGCRGDYGGREILFFDLLDIWGEDPRPLINFIEANNCSNYEFKLYNLHDKVSIYCASGSCFIYDFIEAGRESREGEVEFFIPNKTKVVLKNEEVS